MAKLNVEKDGGGYKVNVGNETSEIRATIRWKDKYGNAKSFEAKPLQIIRRVYFIFHTGGDFEAAAQTRKREIEAYKDQWSYIFLYGYEDLWSIKSFVDEAINKVKNNCWLQTTEVSFYTHAGSDGVVGNVRTSKYNLADETGNGIWDEKQLSLEGWKKIDFNFDPNNSIINFYGCKGNTFAENFIDIHNVLYASFNGGSSADSESYEELNSSWLTFEGEDIYYVSPTGTDSALVPMGIIKRGREKWNREIACEKFITNISLTKEGDLIGKSKKGNIILKKANIKYY